MRYHICVTVQDTPPATSLDELALARLVDQLSEFDRKMNGVVVDSGILAGIPDGAISRVGENVPPPPSPIPILPIVCYFL